MYLLLLLFAVIACEMIMSLEDEFDLLQYYFVHVQ